MGLVELFVIAVGLSMDAFAVAICKGLSMRKINYKYALLVGLFFGGFQAGMPLIGYLLGTQFKDSITSIDHWIAFVLLAVIGINMIRESRSKDDDCGCNGGACANVDQYFSLKSLTVMALATSIDALAIGVTFAFLQVKIVPAVSIIGTTTFAISIIGVIIGNVFGSKFKSKAELTGGLILIVMGLKILFEHLGLL